MTTLDTKCRDTPHSGLALMGCRDYGYVLHFCPMKVGLRAHRMLRSRHCGSDVNYPVFPLSEGLSVRIMPRSDCICPEVESRHQPLTCPGTAVVLLGRVDESSIVHARVLFGIARSVLGHNRVNLIPYNTRGPCP